MRRRSLAFFILLVFTVSAAFTNGTPAYATERSNFHSSAPPGFEILTADREVILDAYFGGQKLHQVRATLSPGSVTFHDPDALARLIPDVARLPELVAGLTGPLPANVSLACSSNRDDGCQTLKPARVGIILDEERFRVDIFVSADLLANVDLEPLSYLERPNGQASLISFFGATVSGSSGGERSWHFQNRAIASVGDLRLRSDSSLSSNFGLAFDNLTVETDRKDWRYTGGIFWTPGTDLIGRRRLLGLGMATQIDTRQDKTSLMTTPLAVFLQQPAKIEVLVDGRVVSSRIYPAGNRLIDTAGLPSGSYEVGLRIQEDGQASRQERRFFTKGSQMAPLGRPLFSVFAGVLPSSDHDFSLKGRTLFYETTAAYRLTPSLGLDAVVIGTTKKIILESGATLLTSLAQVRIAGLVSSSADFGAVVRASSTGQGPLSFSFDLRTIKSHDERPLLPISSSSGTFSEDPRMGFTDQGSFTQVQSIVGYRLGQASLRLTGLYRRNSTQKANYGIEASLEFPAFRAGGMGLVLQAAVRKTDQDFASFLGARFLLNKGSLAFAGSGGVRHQSGSTGKSNRLIGEGQAAWSHQLRETTQLSVDAALGQDAEAMYARTSASIRSPIFDARADVLQHFGSDGFTQFAAAMNGGIAVSQAGISVAGGEINDAAMTVSVSGGNSAQRFEVLVNEVVRGTVSNGGRLVLFLPPYLTYDVRVRPYNSQIASFDTAPKKVTLYPGNVAALNWKITPLFILFGRAIDIAGNPVALADISGSYGVAQTDAEGYFQIETKAEDSLHFIDQKGRRCMTVARPKPAVDNVVSGGDMVCS